MITYHKTKPREFVDLGVINAMAALNSWARHRESHFLSSNVRRSIYYYKNQVLAQLAKQGRLELGRVSVSVSCRDCGGDGRYKHWDGGERNGCWACNSTGNAILNFIESRVLPEGPVWHTPEHKAPYELRKAAADTQRQFPADWTVNQPGKPLEPARMADCLNEVEDWLYSDGLPQEYKISWQSNPPFVYKLPIGERPEICAFCSTEWVKKVGYIASTNLVIWRDHICDACAAQYTNEQGLECFPPFPEPEALTDDEAVQEWISKRAGWTHYRSKSSNDEIPF